MLGAVCALAAGLATAAPAAAQLPIPSLPPIGGPAPGSGGGHPPPSRPAPVSNAPGSVTEHVDVGQTGHLFDNQLVAPLARRWRVRADPGPVLAAEGRVYARRGNAIVGLSQRNGRLLWSRPVGNIWGAAYDRGVVYANTYSDVTAMSARTGAVLWRRVAQDPPFGSPVANGGVVYIQEQGGTYGTLDALGGSDGHLIWSGTTEAQPPVPALDRDQVYLAGGCGGAHALGRADGRGGWSRNSCTPGPGPTGAIHDGRFWVPSPWQDASSDNGKNPVWSADGQHLFNFLGQTTPVFVAGLAIISGDHGLVARRETTGKRVWRRRLAPDQLIAIGPDVYVRNGDHLVVLAARSGRTLWSKQMHSGGELHLAAAHGLLLWQEGSRLTAWQSYYRPPAHGIAVDATRYDVFAGRSFGFLGVLGSALRHGPPRVRIDAAGWRDRRFSRFDVRRAEADGWFGERVIPFKNLRLRAVVRGTRSRVLRVFVYPRVKLGRAHALGRRRAVLRASIRAPRTRLTGHRLVLYFAHRRSRHIRRISVGVIHGRHARMVFRPIRGASNRDRVYFCVRRGLKLGLGRPDRLHRRCGRRRIKL